MAAGCIVRIHLLGTAREIDAALALLRTGLDNVHVGQPATDRTGDLLMVTVEAATRLDWLVIERPETVDRRSLREAVQVARPPADTGPSATQRRPRRT